MANNTLLFKEVVGTYDDFISSTVASETIESTNVYSGGGDSNDSGSTIDSAVWTKEIYRILIRHFRNYEVAFDNIDDFLDNLWERIEVHAPNYYQRKHYYNRLLQMTDSQLLDNGEAISNLIEHTDDAVSDVYDKLKNITNQTQSKNYGAYAQRLRNQIYNAQMDLIRDFCRKFEGLFLLIGTTSVYCG